MTDQEMAEALKAKGWKVEEPWTSENCKHPVASRFGQGCTGLDGSWSLTWRCQLCGYHETSSGAANPNGPPPFCWN